MKLKQKILIIAAFTSLNLSCNNVFAYSSLSQAITNNTAVKTFDIDEDISTNLGAMKGDELTINGNNHSITVNSGKKLTVSKSKTLILNEIGKATIIKDSQGNITGVDVKNSFKGAPNTGITVTSGTLKINNSVFTNNEQAIVIKSSKNSDGTIYPAVANVINTIFYDNYMKTKGASYSGAVFSNISSNVENLSGLFMNNKTVLEDVHVHGVSSWNTGNIKNLSADFINNVGISKTSYVDGSAIYNFGTIDSITSDFIGNGSFGMGTGEENVTGAIYSKNLISSIDSKFIGNWAKSLTMEVYGGAISNRGPMGDIKGLFKENYATSQNNDVYGGAIYNWTDFKIDSIKADFEGNYISLYSGKVYNTGYGGAIANDGTITSFIDGAFRNNYVTISDNPENPNNYTGLACGGAIANFSKGKIPLIKGIFENNSVTGNNNNYANAGALYNEGNINEIVADFRNNYAYSGINVSNGGAIFNCLAGKIGSIIGDFDNNHAESGGKSVRGGAIRNNSIIGEIKGNFSNNYALLTSYNENTSAMGGAIFNGYEGTVGKIIGDFTNNFVSAQKTGKGGAVYNGSNITFEDSSFTNNASDNLGGAIFNDGRANIIANNRDVVFSNNIVGDITQNSDGSFSASGALNDVHNLGVLNLNAEASKNITFNGEISGELDEYSQVVGEININKSDLIYKTLNENLNFSSHNITQTKGTINFLNNVSNNTINIYDGSTNFKNSVLTRDEINNYGSKDVNINNSMLNNVSIMNDSGKLNISESGISAVDENIKNCNEGIFNINNSVIEINDIENSKNTNFNIENSIITAKSISNENNSNFILKNSNLSEVTDASLSFKNNNSKVISDNSVISGSSMSNYRSEITLENNSALKINNITLNNETDLDVKNSAIITDKLISSSKSKTNLEQADLIASQLSINSESELNTNNSFIKSNSLSLSTSSSANFNNSILEDLNSIKNNKSSIEFNNSSINSNSLENTGNGNINLNNSNLIIAETFNNKKGKVNLTDSIIQAKTFTLSNGTVKLDENSKIKADNIANNGGEISTPINGLLGKVKNNSIINFTTGGTTIDDITGYGEINLDANENFYLNHDIDENILNLNKGTLVFDRMKNLTYLSGNGGAINILNNQIDNITIEDFEINSKTNLALDFDLKTEKSDSFTTEYLTSASNYLININSLNLLGKTDKNYIKVHLGDTTGLGRENVTSDTFDVRKIMTPVRTMNGHVEDGWLTLSASSGKSYNDFNPAVFNTSVGNQAGGYFAQSQVLNDGFYRMDCYSKYTSRQRYAWEHLNRYASAWSDVPIYTEANQISNSVWSKPYTSFEKVNLKGGPNVSTTGYGSLFGADSALKIFKRGYKGFLSTFVGYNGSYTSYPGVRMNQQGGLLGLTGTLMRGNFFTGLTASVGASAGDSSTMYGTDKFAMISAGIASKTGYNIELREGKIILQPTIFMGYSMVKTFDYTNAAGVRITSDPLHALEISPGIKLIGNTKNHWQPYLSTELVWNIFLAGNKVRANDVRLPELSIKPYVQYGVGVQKTFKNKFSGFMQAMIRNGGRTGIVFTCGFRWALGKDYDSPNSNNEEKGKRTIIKSFPKL